MAAATTTTTTLVADTLAPQPFYTKTHYNEWGPTLWDIMISYALTYPYQPNAARRALAQQFYTITVLQLILCSQCVGHYTTMIAEHPPDTRHRDALVRWVIARHNDVNVRLNKPVMSYEAVMTQWYGPLWATKIQQDELRHGHNQHTSNLPPGAPPPLSTPSIIGITVSVILVVLVLLVLLLLYYWRPASSKRPSMQFF